MPNAFVPWSVVRPDSLLEGEVSESSFHEGLVKSPRTPGSTRMANVEPFMRELVTSAETWAARRSRLPVIVDDPASGAATPRPG